MHINKFLIVFSAFAMSISACQNGTTETTEPSEPALDVAAVKAYIVAMEDTLAMAYNNKDPELFAKFYAEDAITYGEGREQLFGKDAITSHFKRNVARDSSFNDQFSYETIDVFAQGDIAVENGKWIEMNAAGEETAHGFYMVVFEKQADGSYRSIRDMWNSAHLPQAEEREEPNDE